MEATNAAVNVLVCPSVCSCSFPYSEKVSKGAQRSLWDDYRANKSQTVQVEHSDTFDGQQSSSSVGLLALPAFAASPPSLRAGAAVGCKC